MNTLLVKGGLADECACRSGSVETLQASHVVSLLGLLFAVLAVPLLSLSWLSGDSSLRTHYGLIPQRKTFVPERWRRKMVSIDAHYLIGDRMTKSRAMLSTLIPQKPHLGPENG